MCGNDNGAAGHLGALSSALCSVFLSLSLVFGAFPVAPALADPLDSPEEPSATSEDSGQEGQGTDAQQSETSRQPSASNGAGSTAASKKSAKQKKAVKLSVQADRIATKLAKQTIELETASEDLGDMNARLRAAREDVAKTKKRLKKTQAALTAARANASESAREIYKNGQTRLLSVLLGATTFEDFASRLYLYEAVTSDWLYTFRKSKKLESKLAREKKVLGEKQDSLQVLKGEIQLKGDEVAAKLESQIKTLSKLDKKLVKLVNKKTEKYLARHASATKRANSAALAWYAGADGASTSKSGSHPKIVDIARQFLGVKYVWGGETPEGGFDCSGLVMYCYGKIGIKLTHFARTQYSEGKHIAKSALMPGDLVFFGPDVAGIHHVGIYIGDDKFIHAPHTGDVVRISKLSSRTDCVGACRPK